MSTWDEADLEAYEDGGYECITCSEASRVYGGVATCFCVDICDNKKIRWWHRDARESTILPRSRGAKRAGPTIILSTRLNKLNASAFPLVWNISPLRPFLGCESVIARERGHSQSGRDFHGPQFYEAGEGISIFVLLLEVQPLRTLSLSELSPPAATLRHGLKEERKSARQVQRCVAAFHLVCVYM